MPRRLRIQFAGALYHVINRGNYRSDVFGSAGAALAFETVLDEACRRYGWRVHAYALMRNHYHLGLETTEPNLVDGMHWLQSTFATRFNRYREESGHLFQGRYQALLIENSAALVRVVNYIHLNPVRAKIIPPEQITSFRWSSLAKFSRADRPSWLTSSSWLTQLGWSDSADGWRSYVALLTAMPDENLAKEEAEFCHGWAIGTDGWRKAIAKEHAHLSLQSGIAADELRELKHARWMDLLERVLRDAGKTIAQAEADPKGTAWKCLAAERMRREAGASHVWIARQLHMGSANSIRSKLSQRHRRLANQPNGAAPAP